LLVRDAMTIARRARCLVLLAIAASTGAHAAHADPDPPARPPRHRATARWLSLGGALASATLAGVGGLMLKYGRAHRPRTDSSIRIGHDGAWLIGIGGVSTLFTPALGEWYAGEWFTPGMELRGVGIGIGLGGIAAYFLSGHRCEQFGDQCFNYQPRDPRPATVLISIGAATYLGGMILDIVRAPDAADRYNARHVQFVPTAITGASGLHPGLELRAAF
jgi:hypothetical protein